MPSSSITTIPDKSVLQWYDSIKAWTATTVLVGVEAATVTTSTTVKNGVITRAGDAAGGVNNEQFIAHQLGKTPLVVRITATKFIASVDWSHSWGTYNGSTNVCVGFTGNSGGVDPTSYNNTTKIIDIRDVGAGDSQVASVGKITSTSVMLTWVKAGGPNSNTIHMAWEANA